MKKKLLYVALTIALLFGVVGCIHLSVGVDRKYIPDVVEEKFLSNQDAHPVTYVTYEREAEFPNVDGEMEKVKFGPRYETQKERDLKWELEGVQAKQNELARQHADLIKKFNTFMEIHNETQAALLKKTEPVKEEPFLSKGLLSREELEEELDKLFPVIDDEEVIERALIEDDLDQILNISEDNNETNVGDGDTEN